MATPLERLKKIKYEAIQKLIEDGLLFSTRIHIGMSTCELAAGSVACIGCCALAPCFSINGKVHGEMTPKKVRGLFPASNGGESNAG